MWRNDWSYIEIINNEVIVAIYIYQYNHITNLYHELPTIKSYDRLLLLYKISNAWIKTYCSNNDTLVKVTHSSSALSDVYFGTLGMNISRSFDQDIINYNIVHFQPIWPGPNFRKKSALSFTSNNY